MLKKYKILLIILLLAIISSAGYWLYNKAKNNNGLEQTAFSTGFIMLDDEKNLAWSEMVNLSAEARTQFENKISGIKADLAVAKDKDQRLADYNNLAIYEKYLGNYRESYGAYLQSLKLESQARVAWQNFADVLLKMKAYESAAMAYQKAIDLNKYIPESYVKLADYYKARGNGEKAEATYKLALDTIKDSTESDTLVLGAYADWLIDNKRYDEAIKILRQLEAKQPDNKAAIERKIQGLRK